MIIKEGEGFAPGRPRWYAAGCFLFFLLLAALTVFFYYKAPRSWATPTGLLTYHAVKRLGIDANFVASPKPQIVVGTSSLCLDSRAVGFMGSGFICFAFSVLAIRMRRFLYTRKSWASFVFLGIVGAVSMYMVNIIRLVVDFLMLLSVSRAFRPEALEWLKKLWGIGGAVIYLMVFYVLFRLVARLYQCKPQKLGQHEISL